MFLHFNTAINDSTVSLGTYIHPIFLENGISNKSIQQIQKVVNRRITSYLDKTANYDNCKALHTLILPLYNVLKEDKIKEGLKEEDEPGREELEGGLEELLWCLGTGFEGPREVTDEEWTAQNTFSVETTPIRPKTWDGTLEGFMLLYYESLKHMNKRQFYNSGYFGILKKKGYDPVDILAHYERYVCNHPWEYIKAKVRQAMKDSQSNPYYKPTSEIEKAILEEDAGKQETATAVFKVDLETLESEPVEEAEVKDKSKSKKK